jgi:predicted enzyme related to lactoylglutathione lyase
MGLSIPGAPCVGKVKPGRRSPGRDARKGATMGSPVVHFEVLGPDADALQRFYADQFGWKIDASNPMKYGLVDTGDGKTSGGVGPGQDGQAVVTFYMAVDDLDAALERIGKAGGRTITPPTEIPNLVTFAHFADPAGNVLGLVKS